LRKGKTIRKNNFLFSLVKMDALTTYGVDEVPSNIEIRSDEVTPISSSVSDRRYIFRLEPQGYLDSNTLLQFKLKKSAAAPGTDTQLRVNSFNGALGAVKRVIFRVGDFVLNDTDKVHLWSTLSNLSHRRRQDLNSYDAFYYGNQFHSRISEAADATHGEFEVDSALSGYDITNRAANSYKLETVSDDCFKYGIPLGRLIPALQGRQIPLYLFDQYRIVIEVEFHPPSVYMNSRNGAAGAAVASDTAADIEDVELLVDYIIYPSSVLEADRAATLKEGGLELDFYNVVNVQRQLDVAAGTTQAVATNAQYQTRGVLQDKTTAVDFRIGQENREIHQIFMIKQKQGKVPTAGGANNAGSLMLDQRIDGVASESIQFSLNGVDVYPEPKTLTSSQYDQMYMALGYRDLQVERPMFYTDPNSLSAIMTSATSGLQGTYKPIGYDARVMDSGIAGSGTLIGRYPIVVKYKATPSHSLVTFGAGDTGSAAAPDQSGVYDVDFFISTSRRAVIRSSPMGMQVSVSF